LIFNIFNAFPAAKHNSDRLAAVWPCSWSGVDAVVVTSKSP